MEKSIDNVVLILSNYFPSFNIEEHKLAAEQFINSNSLPKNFEAYEEDGEDKWYTLDVLDGIFNRYQPDSSQLYIDNAERIPVTVGNKVYQTYIDNYGVQRFVPNSIIQQILNWEQNSVSNSQEAILNKLSVGYVQGKYSEEDMLDFYTSTGYSVSGLIDVSYFNHLPVNNPLWN